MADFASMFYREKPVDWLIDIVLSTKVCYPGQGVKECASARRKIRVFIKLFGRHSLVEIVLDNI